MNRWRRWDPDETVLCVVFFLAATVLIAGIAMAVVAANATARAKAVCEAKGPEWTLIVSRSGQWCAMGNWAK